MFKIPHKSPGSSELLLPLTSTVSVLPETVDMIHRGDFPACAEYSPRRPKDFLFYANSLR